MQILFESPRIENDWKPMSQRRSYVQLFAALRQNPGHWVAVDPENVAGKTTTEKQTRMHVGAAARGLRVQTTTQDGKLYVRNLTLAGL